MVKKFSRFELNKLFIWCEEQRESRRNGTLSVERISKLDALGFDWNAK
jgi:hypothetical protein